MTEAVKIELSYNGSELYIFFGGINGRIGMPVFEFYNASGIIDQHKMFFRDLNQAWYQCGLEGVGSNVAQIAMYIEQRIEEINPTSVTFIGNSMGGFAAIMFHALINKGKAIAFSPQTFIDPLRKVYYRDLRWRRQLLPMYLHRFYRFQENIWDLKSLLKRSPGALDIRIFVSVNDSLDMLHASRLQDVLGVDVQVLNKGQHNVVAVLRDEGRLVDILRGTA